MAKDERGLHIQTPEQFEVQAAHMLEDLGPGEGAYLPEDELLNLRPKLRVRGDVGGVSHGSAEA